jgi:hypothetical protein
MGINVWSLNNLVKFQRIFRTFALELNMIDEILNRFFFDHYKTSIMFILFPDILLNLRMSN